MMEQRLVLLAALVLAAAVSLVSGQDACSGLTIGRPVITFQNVDATGALSLTGNLVLSNNNDGDLAINKVEVAIKLTGQTVSRNVAAQCPAASDTTTITCTFTANVMYGMPAPTGVLATLNGVATVGTTVCNGTATTVNSRPTAITTIGTGNNEAGTVTGTCPGVVVAAPVVTDKSVTSINGQGLLSVKGTVALTNTAGNMLALSKVEVDVTLGGVGVTRTLLADCPGSTSALTVACNFQADIMFNGAISMVPSATLTGKATQDSGGSCFSTATTINTAAIESGNVASTVASTATGVATTTTDACSVLAIDAPQISAVSSTATNDGTTVAVAGSVVLTNLGTGQMVNVRAVTVQVKLTGMSATGTLTAVCPVTSTPQQSVTCTFQGTVAFTGPGRLPATLTGVATLMSGTACQGATASSNELGSVRELAAAQAVMDANAAAAIVTDTSGITTSAFPNAVVVYTPRRNTIFGGRIIYYG